MNRPGKNLALPLLLGCLVLTLLAVSGHGAAQDPSALQRELVIARKLNDEFKARLAAAEAALAQSQAVAERLRQQFQQLQAGRDKNYGSVVELTNQLHKAFNEIKQLKAENARLSTLLPGPPPKGLEGLVTAVDKSGQVEISLGSDDGLKPGHQFSVCRAKGTAIDVLGQIMVVTTTPDKAICRAGTGSLKGAVQKGDRVTTGQQPAAAPAAEGPKPGEPPFLIGGTVLEVLEDGQVEISFGTADGLKSGHRLEVYRETGRQGIYVGRVEVVQAGPKRARCKIVAEQDTVRKGDRITSKL